MLWIGAALCLIALPGMAFSYWVTLNDGQPRVLIIAGYGMVAGLIGVPLLMRMLDLFGVPLSFTASGLGAIVLTALFVVLAARGVSVAKTGLGASDFVRSSPAGAISLLIVVLLLMLLGQRFLLLAGEVAWNPLYPWDATMHWATKSRVWFEHLELRPFLENADWLTTSDSEAYTDHHPGYPITIPLLQVYMTSAVGSWNESAMNLPWLLCFIGLGVAFFAQAKLIGANNIVAMSFTYFLLSMPLLNTHVALAGYADFFLGTCYCLALMAFYNWSISRQRSQAVFAVFFALSCLLIKNEGFFWALTLVPALLVVLLPGKRAPLALLGVVVTAVLVLLVFPEDLQIAGHSLEELRIFYRGPALIGIFSSFFVHDNWHLFAYLLTGLLIANGLFNRPAFKELKGISIALAAALILYLFLFLFTAYSGGAIQLTAVTRISLQLVPAAMFFCLLLFKALLDSRTSGN